MTTSIRSYSSTTFFRRHLPGQQQFPENHPRNRVVELLPSCQENPLQMTKSEASRQNGARSQGPVTPEGKARSAQNATKHGLDSKVVVLANESRAEYHELLSDYLRFYAPTGPVELDLVHEIAANRWRMRRCLRLESAAFDGAFETGPETLLDQAFGQNGAIRLLNRYEGRLRRAYERATVELRRIQAERNAAAAEQETITERKQRNEPRGYLDTYLEAVRLTPQLPVCPFPDSNGKPSPGQLGPNGYEY